MLTPVARYWICKHGSHFAQETMECLGGNGHVEAGGAGAGPRGGSGARRLARDLALRMQAVLLRQHGGDAVFEGFCRPRLSDDAHDAFGQLPPGVDLEALLRRARP